MKGHKGKNKADKSCSMCPNNCCSSDGKSLKCKCDYHSTTGIEVGQSLPPLEGSTMITSDGVHTFFFSPAICQGALSWSIGSNACTVISLLTGISFLNNEFQLPAGHEMPEKVVSMYKEKIIQGNGMYEIIDLPDNQMNLSIADIAGQIYLPIKDPGNWNGIMVDGQGEDNFSCLVAEAISRPGRKAFVFILDPDHAFCLCIDDNTIAVFDSHRSSVSQGAAILFAPLAKVSSFLFIFHATIRRCYACSIEGANYVDLQLENA